MLSYTSRLTYTLLQTRYIKSQYWLHDVSFSLSFSFKAERDIAFHVLRCMIAVAVAVAEWTLLLKPYSKRNIHHDSSPMEIKGMKGWIKCTVNEHEYWIGIRLTTNYKATMRTSDGLLHLHLDTLILNTWRREWWLETEHVVSTRGTVDEYLR